MRQTRTLATLAVALVLIGSSSAGTDAASSGNWTTRGGSDDRQQSAQENFGSLAALPVWNALAHDWDDNPVGETIGATGSQPLFVNDRIYHMAGDTLWEIDTTGKAIPLFKNMNWVTGANGQRELRPSTSGITYKEINGRPYLYFGTGDNKLCIQPLVEGAPRCVRISDLTAPEHRIVTTPLVMLVKDGNVVQHDITIMGDKQGRIWAIQGLATAASLNEVLRVERHVGGWVLASPVQIGAEEDLSFVWGNDLGGSGSIGAFRVIPQTATQALRFADVWPDYVYTPAGVADGFAKDGPHIYASDIGGTMYQIDTDQLTRNIFPYATQAGPMFVNAAPAVDDKHVYFSIRNLGSAQANTTSPGRIIALSKETFSLDGGWTADLPAPANTNPLIWTKGPGVLLVGDTRGTLHALGREDGARTPFAIAPAGKTNGGLDICTPVDRLDLGAPGQAGQAWQTLTGISEPIIASGSTGQGLLLVGVSGLGPDDQLTGSLRAFRAGGSYNVAWREIVKPTLQLAPGQPYEVKGDLTLTPWGGAPATDRPVGLEAYWVPDDAARQTGAQVRLLQRTTLTLSTTRPTPYAVTFTPTETDGTAGAIRIFANPEQLLFTPAENGQLLRQTAALSDGKAANAYDAPLAAGNQAPLVAKVAGADLPSNCAGAQFELLASGWGDAMADNLLTAPVDIEQSVDLSVRSLWLPGDLSCDPAGAFEASWVLHNPSGRTVKGVPYKVSLTHTGRGETYDVAWGSRDLPPGDTPVSMTIARIGCDTYLRVRVELNLGPEPRPVREPDYSNNAATRDVQVAAQQSPQWRPQTGSGTSVIIVPDDCQSNPDPTSRQPCLNYPNLNMP